MSLLTSARESARLSAEARRRTGDAPAHPTTSTARDYTQDELDFSNAVAVYKSRTGRRFLTTADYLHIAKTLGYSQCHQTPMRAIGESNIAILTTDLAGIVTFASAAFLDRLRLPASHVIGRPLVDLVDDDGQSLDALSVLMSQTDRRSSVPFISIQQSYWAAKGSRTASGVVLCLSSMEDELADLADSNFDLSKIA